MTLKIYTKQDDIPEGLRAEYKQSGNQWVPDLSDDHPVLVLNKTLIQEKGVAEAKVKKLSADLDDALETAKTSGVPRGQALVPKADAEALTEYKALGAPADLKTKIEEHKSLSEESIQRKRTDSLRQLAKDSGYNEEAFTRLPNLPEFISRPSKDGKSTDWFAQLKDDKGVITEKPAKEFVESSPDIAPFMASLKTTQGVKVPGSVMVAAPVNNTDPFASAKAFGEAWNQNRAAGTNVMERFGLAPAKTA